MHIICSNFGSIQPESKVAVWSTTYKPAMSGSQADDGVLSMGSSDELVDIVDDSAGTCIKQQLLLSPAQFFDIVTNEPISNDRCFYNCQELDKVQKKFQEAQDIYHRVKRETHGSEEVKKNRLQRRLLKNIRVVAILRYGTGYAT